MLTVSIIEDEYSAQNELKSFILRYGNENGLKFDISVYGDALTFFESYKRGNDIIFMDIELPNLNGMEAAKRLRKTDNAAVIIFVTNMAQFAVKGYEVDALDFTVKPLSYPAFCMKMDKAVRVVQGKSSHIINVNIPGRVVRIDVRELKYVEVMGHKLFYHTETEVFEGRGSITNEEERLNRYDFMRCNSCYLINPLQIKSIGKDEVEMRGGDVLPISHSKKKKFLSEIAEYFGKNK